MSRQKLITPNIFFGLDYLCVKTAVHHSINSKVASFYSRRVHYEPYVCWNKLCMNRSVAVIKSFKSC